MLSRLTPPVIERALRATQSDPPFPPAANRAAWAEVRAAIGARAGAIIHQAETDAGTPIPTVTATLYLDFLRTGRRHPYQEPIDRRRSMLRNLVLAECLEGNGRFLDPLLDLIWAVCEESSWARPAHQKALTNMAQPFIDLSAAETALELAEADLLLGNRLHPDLGKRIRYEINRRCFVPYLDRHDHHWMFSIDGSLVNNWAAVCSGGVVGAALHLLHQDEPGRLADMIHRALTSLDDFLDSFDPDGGTSEGPFCWAYGVGYYAILAHLLEHYTNGAISLWTEHARTIARFPLHSALSPNRVANFSDCDIDFTHIPAHLAYLARRLQEPDLMRMAQSLPPNFREGRLAWGLRTLYWRPDPEALRPFIPARHDWFRGLQWMIARMDPVDPDALVLAAKGGHNGEMHNQNDVGHFIVHVNGESVLTDLGRGRFNRAYFSEGRYDFLVNSSRGHSVPVVNGLYQQPGKEHAATLLEHHAGDDIDRLKLDIAAAYPPEADLAKLERTICLHREPPRGWIEVVDEVAFLSKSGEYAGVLITLGNVKIDHEPGTILLGGERGVLRVHYDAARLTPRVETETEVPLDSGPVNVQRVILAVQQPIKHTTVRLRIEPA